MEGYIFVYQHEFKMNIFEYESETYERQRKAYLTLKIIYNP